MSFHEKSSWVCLTAILLVYVPYFGAIFSQPGDLLTPWAFIGAVISLVVIMSVAHIILAISTASVRKRGSVPPLDERENGIELTAVKVFSYVLVFSVATWCIAAYVGIPITGIEQQHPDIAGMVESQPAGNAASQDGAASQDVEEGSSLSNLPPIPATSVLLYVHVLFAGFVLANVVYYAAIVFGYRRCV